MSGKTKRVKQACGVTVIGPVNRDPEGFHQRLLLSGLRLGRGAVPATLYAMEEGVAIAAISPECTGYLLSTDGMEASESDLYGFLSAELRDGERVTISGEYEPDPGRTVRSSAYFHLSNGRLMCAEERVLILPDGGRTLLRQRADLYFGNVVPLRPARAVPDLEP